MIQAYKLGFSYPKQKVFTDISFFLNQGEICALLGKNGDGKTTLLKILAGMEKPNTGNVVINGKEMQFNGQVFESVSYLQQNTYYDVRLTVFEVLLLSIKENSFFIKNEEKEKVFDVLETIGILDLSERYICQLSGGQLKMVFIAQALCRKKNILLLDEPISNLDYYNQHFILRKVYDLSKKNELTTMISLHDVNMAFVFADKVLVMSDCGIYNFGKPEDVINSKMMQDVFRVKAIINKSDTGLYVEVVDTI